ncbi:MAG: Brp/Blh family beta-carotene 15,15'-dioxygenase [Actinobacteria bacterium]|nr:Brp/Blh family beta-carotene 15,15'-dioxygenase [Actinomycetota bacterium]
MEPVSLASTVVSPNVRRVLRRWVLWPSWLFVAALVLLFAAGLTVPPWAEYLPFALSLVAFGLPHGAVDHLAVPRLLGRKAGTTGPVLAVGLLYLVLGGLYLALWFAAPVAAFALFIALTWFHWGGGDLHALAAFASDRGEYPAGRTRRALTLLVRGGLPMLVPLLAFPETYRTVVGSIVDLFVPGSAGVLSWIFDPSFRLFAGVVFALLAVGVLASGYGSAKKSGSRRVWLVDVAETAVLALYFALVPPVLAVGLYFCLWHAPRHVARLVLLDGKSAGALEAGRVALALVRFARDAAPLTVAALVLLLGLYLAVPEADAAPASLLALYLVLVSVLTLPHVVVVSFMDFRQGLWRGSRQPSAVSRQQKPSN